MANAMVMRRRGIVAALCVMGFAALMVCHAEPPPGPKNQANCPVTGARIQISDKTPSVNFKNGQKLYFSSEKAADMYRKSPRDFWLSPHEMPLKGMDGKRGLPDLRNETRYCPMSNESSA